MDETVRAIGRSEVIWCNILIHLPILMNQHTICNVNLYENSWHAELLESHPDWINGFCILANWIGHTLWLGFSPELLRHQHISGFSIKLVRLGQSVCLIGLVYSEDLPNSASKNVGKAALKVAGMKAILHPTTILSNSGQKSGTKAGHNAAEP